MYSPLPSIALIGLLLLTPVPLARAAAGQNSAPDFPQARSGRSLSLQISRAMGDLRWGMSKSALQKKLGVEVVSALTARSTGWNASLLRGDNDLGRGGAVMTSHDQTSRTFYFFRAGKLRKIYRVFEALVLPEGNFATFAAALQRGFGPGEMREGALSPSSPEWRRWVEWNAGRTRVRAIDETNGRGIYSLTFEDRESAR